jgi:hypothetical protein
MGRFFLMLCICAWMYGCDDTTGKSEPGTGSSPYGAGDSVVDDNDEGHSEFARCGGPGQPDECEIFKQEFRTLDVKQLAILGSARVASPVRCCITRMLEGDWSECCNTYRLRDKCPDEFTRVRLGTHLSSARCG